MTSFALAFVTMVILDLVWGQYVITTAKGKAREAAFFAAAIAAFNGLTTVFIITSYWNIFALVMGAAVGTWAAIKLGSHIHD